MKHFGLLASAFALAAGLSVLPAQAQAQTAPAAKAESASQALAALFAASDETNLRRNPISALFRGDTRYAGRLGNF